ncbi:hypothetical protein PACTADRAFT_48998, partial [Pachysolen tannophilus NRRL Y-2460]
MFRFRMYRTSFFGAKRVLSYSSIAKNKNGAFITDSISILEQQTNSLLKDNKNLEQVELSLDVLKACKILQDKILSFDKFDSNGKLQELQKINLKILNNSKIDKKFLSQYWLLRPYFDDLKNSIEIFYLQNKKAIIPKELVMIPFRNFLKNGDIDNAIKLLDLSVASDRYLKFQRNKTTKYLIQYALSCFGFIGLIEILTRIFFTDVQNMAKIYAMLLAYIGNTSFLATIAFSGKNSQTDHLRFANGTFQRYWSEHADELNMISKIVDVDLKINDKQNSGFISKEISDELGKRNIIYKEPEQEIMLRQYWLSGGDGFEWVEPDQDPAELLWDEHLKNLKAKNLRQSSQEDMLEITDQIISN